MSGPQQWTISIGDWPHFEIVHEISRRDGEFGSDGDLNGRFSTRLAAINELITDYELTRVKLAAQIARAKRMRRAEISRLNPLPAITRLNGGES